MQAGVGVTVGPVGVDVFVGVVVRVGVALAVGVGPVAVVSTTSWSLATGAVVFEHVTLTVASSDEPRVALLGTMKETVKNWVVPGATVIEPEAGDGVNVEPPTAILKVLVLQLAASPRRLCVTAKL
jgi:hypothetical protein